MAFDDQKFMARALRLAELGRYSTHPNPCVGCVVVQHGKIVSEGHHVMAGDRHAEELARNQERDRLARPR